jgi:hypothetical protein
MMKYPPEKYYEPINGSHDWIAEQLRFDLAGLGYRWDSYQLISDDQTMRDVANKQKPSYRVVVRDENGVYKPVKTRNGEIAYFNFPLSPRDIAAQERSFIEEQDRIADREARRLAVQQQIMP